MSKATLEVSPPELTATSTPQGFLSRNRFRIAGFAVLAIALVLYPILVPSSRWIDAANHAIIASIGAIALNVLIGVAGQFSLGSAAFMAIGAFTAASITTQLIELPFLVTILLGAVVGGLFALVVGLIALRIRGFYLALATIALHYVVIFLVQRFQEGTVGIIGFMMPTPDLFGWTIRRATDWYPVLLVMLVLIAWGVWNMLRSKTGRAFRAVKDRDIAAAILGVNVTRTKMVAFVVTSMIIGFQGAVYAYYLGVVTYESFHLDVAVQYIAMIMIGGVASVAGSILGAIFVIILPFLVQGLVPSLPDWFPFIDVLERNVFAIQLVIYGLAIILFMLKIPKGLVYAFKRLGLGLRRLLLRGSSVETGRKAGA